MFGCRLQTSKCKKDDAAGGPLALFPDGPHLSFPATATARRRARLAPAWRLTLLNDPAFEAGADKTHCKQNATFLEPVDGLEHADAGPRRSPRLQNRTHAVPAKKTTSRSPQTRSKKMARSAQSDGGSGDDKQYTGTPARLPKTDWLRVRDKVQTQPDVDTDSTAHNARLKNAFEIANNCTALSRYVD